MAASAEKLHLIDASIYIFRAWFSIPDSMTDDEGTPVNALYGFGSFLFDFLEKTRATRIAVAFDESLTSSYRNEIYPEYKANREPPPEDLKPQFAWCRELTRALGITEFASGEYEADDIIGTLAKKARKAGIKSVIVSRDKDLTQILRNGDVYWDYANNTRVPYRKIKEVFGVRPEQVADYLALTGDAVDNIRGVPGIGKKTAQILFENFESLDHIYDSLHEIRHLPLRGASKVAERLENHRENAYLARRLTEICYTVPLQTRLTSLTRKQPDIVAMTGIFDRAGFGTGMRRRLDRLAQSFS